MLNNSLDLLYIVIAFCILWFTIFTCWWIFYVIMTIRRVYQVINSIRRKLKALEDLSKQAKDRFEKTAEYIDLAASGIGKIIGYVKEKKQSKTEKKGKKAE